MAMTTTIPPQAYTRDTLVKAIEWIATQSPTVRQQATTADLIVSFYLQTKRRMSTAQLESPVSGEAFKQDLKHLVSDLKQFEDAPSAAPTKNGEEHHHNHLHTAPSAHAQQHVHLHVQSGAPVVHQAPAPPANFSGLHKNDMWQVDARSMAAARDVQERLNLGSEAEALRMLIALGMERAREMFPD